MAVKKNTYRSQNSSKKKKQKSGKPITSTKSVQVRFSFLNDRRFHMSIGLLSLFFSVFLCLSIVSYLFTGKADQSVVESLSFGRLVVSGLEVQNWLGLIGAGLAHIFVYRLFGIASLLLCLYLFVIGYKIVFNIRLLPLQRTLGFVLFSMLWLGVLLGYIEIKTEAPETSTLSFLCGSVGYQLAYLLNSFAGWGTPLFLVLSLSIFFVYFFRKTAFKDLKGWLITTTPIPTAETSESSPHSEAELNTDEQETPNDVEEGKPAPTFTIQVPTFRKQEPLQDDDDDASTTDGEAAKRHVDTGTASEQPKGEKLKKSWSIFGKKNKPLPPAENPELSIENEEKVTDEEEGEVEELKTPQLVLQSSEESATEENLQASEAIETVQVEDNDFYDPRLDLGSYQFPTLELLNEPSSGKVKVTQQELNENKDRIVKTLNDFKIGISSIKATIGPTVTLYEIVPDAGIKISRIRSLEDDIALSLAALGIRIIAPIPGKGTIGIEVPNKNREMVEIRSILATESFRHTDKALPIALGKTISNEVFVTDLAKMPHLLMAGATGQGKSVGLNVILSSLIYKKHPAELKFVLVDPKKVELTLFNKIERHFLAALPDAEEPIVTDTSKAVHVLNSLCIEMDNRYNLLKDAGCRNIKEYNAKFRKRRLNPDKGHRFLPYIVLVIDELADLMMTAGKEVEMPIARLAQLARAIGIHLVIATQRPSVDVITGIIKANFPARLSFRVSSKIDSRTILDTGGADQLIGMGDMLLSNGSEIIRLQCAYVDTDELERLCDFIGTQRGYETSYLLPEYEEESSAPGAIDLQDRDEMFEAAARLLVVHQQGSTSLIQRKLSLGYNRAGRIIDQLEAAGIVGPFEGSKARQVLVSDEMALEQILSGMPPNRSGSFR